MKIWIFIQLFSILAYPAIDSWYSYSQNNSNINEGNIPPPRPLLFAMPYSSTARCIVKKLSISRWKKWVSTEVVHIVSSANIVQLNTGFPWVILYSSVRMGKNLKERWKFHFISFMSIILWVFIIAIVYVEETPQKIVSVYVVYKILKACPIWKRALELLFKWFPAAAHALLTPLKIIKNFSRKKCPFKYYCKSLSIVKC